MKTEAEIKDWLAVQTAIINREEAEGNKGDDVWYEAMTVCEVLQWVLGGEKA